MCRSRRRRTAVRKGVNLRYVSVHSGVFYMVTQKMYPALSFLNADANVKPPPRQRVGSRPLGAQRSSRYGPKAPRRNKSDHEDAAAPRRLLMPMLSVLTPRCPAAGAPPWPLQPAHGPPVARSGRSTRLGTPVRPSPRHARLARGSRRVRVEWRSARHAGHRMMAARLVARAAGHAEILRFRAGVRAVAEARLCGSRRALGVVIGVAVGRENRWAIGG